MSSPVRRPGIQELVGIAVNSSRLVTRSNAETPLDRVGALGAATLGVQLGACRADLPIAALISRRQEQVVRAAGAIPPQPPPDDRQDRIAAELSALLWHIRYGQQFDAVPRAASLFSEWLSYRARLAAVPPRRLYTFALRVMHEWLSDRCMACGGSGKQEKTRIGNWVRPQGRMQRNAVFRVCSLCNGTRRSLPSHPERMQLLELTREQYDAARWHTHFNAAHGWLGRKIMRLTRPLTAELERRKRRP